MLSIDLNQPPQKNPLMETVAKAAVGRPGLEPPYRCHHHGAPPRLEAEEEEEKGGSRRKKEEAVSPKMWGWLRHWMEIYFFPNLCKQVWVLLLELAVGRVFWSW
jgi:hypothetical protein